MNIVIITGASSGIGQEFALQLDKEYSDRIDEFWLIARRRERLEDVSLLMEHKTRIIALDLTKAQELSQFREVLSIASPNIRMLVNCAGFGLMGAFKDLDIEQQCGMLEVNCKALTKMTHYCIPYMKKNSRIIQMASSAGFMPQEHFAVYAATKAYVLSLSKALKEELRRHKIYVTAVCPGPVDTEFFDIAEQYGTTLAVKKLTMVNSDRVVREAIEASRQKKSMAVCSLLIKMFMVLSKLLPHSFIMWCLRFFR